MGRAGQHKSSFKAPLCRGQTSWRLRQGETTGRAWVGGAPVVVDQPEPVEDAPEATEPPEMPDTALWETPEWEQMDWPPPNAHDPAAADPAAIEWPAVESPAIDSGPGRDAPLNTLPAATDRANVARLAPELFLADCSLRASADKQPAGPEAEPPARTPLPRELVVRGGPAPRLPVRRPEAAVPILGGKSSAETAAGSERCECVSRVSTAGSAAAVMRSSARFG